MPPALDQTLQQRTIVLVKGRRGGVADPKMQARLAELGGTAPARSGAGKDHAAQFRKQSLNLCIGEGRVDFLLSLSTTSVGVFLGAPNP
jgi:hypothetical protein